MFKKDLVNKVSKYYKNNSMYFKDINQIMYYSNDKYIKQNPEKFLNEKKEDFLKVKDKK